MWILVINWSLFVEIEVNPTRLMAYTMVTYILLWLPICTCIVSSSPFGVRLAIIDTCTDVWWTRPIHMNAAHSLTCPLVVSFKKILTYFRSFSFSITKHEHMCVHLTCACDPIHLPLSLFTQCIKIHIVEYWFTCYNMWSFNSCYTVKPTFGYTFTQLCTSLGFCPMLGNITCISRMKEVIPPKRH